jgi:hypothetical protein
MHLSDHIWRRFNALVLGTLCVLAILAYLLVVLVDPHDHLALSLSLERAPINQNQRFSYPALARSQRFDSVVVGTSTARLLRPASFDRLLNARFANLSMNSATAYEQSRILELFIQHHPTIAYLLIGLDSVWCGVDTPLKRYTFREFPEWLYDDNPWNDYLHLLNGKALEQTVRQLEFLAGHRKPRYGFDGYRHFLPTAAEYDLEKARIKIYGQSEPRERHAPETPLNIPLSEREAWTYPALDVLYELLERVPASTAITLFVAPYHQYIQSVPGTRRAFQWQECKRRVAKLAGQRRQLQVLDFMIPSEITWQDGNYWDPLHFTADVADRLERIVAAETLGSATEDPVYRRLTPQQVQ